MPINLSRNRSSAKKASAKSKPGKSQPKKKTNGGWAPEVDLQMESESESELIAQSKYEYSDLCVLQN
ncbi:hypothetical protein RSAG8_05792, partial [Rhizoctonia solani AG-8 WAC10335]